MAYPTLTPSSNTSVSRLPVTGNVDNVNSSDNPLPYGVYITHARSENALVLFKEGAADQVTYVYKSLAAMYWILKLQNTKFMQLMKRLV